jgi:hypothetical protein
LVDGKDRVKRHRRALREFLDRFYEQVSSRHGHLRAGHRRRLQRVSSRAAYLALSTVAKSLQTQLNSEARDLLDRALFKYDHNILGNRQELHLLRNRDIPETASVAPNANIAVRLRP